MAKISKSLDQPQGPWARDRSAQYTRMPRPPGIQLYIDMGDQIHQYGYEIQMLLISECLRGW